MCCIVVVMAKADTRPRALRERLAEATRRIILEALVAELSEHGPYELTYLAVAKRAGVSVRTMYRHFPTRDELFDGLSHHVTSVLGIHDRPQSREEVVATVRRLFVAYDRNAPLIKAQLNAGLSGSVRSHARRKRVGVVHALLADSLPHLPAGRRVAAAGLLTCLFSATVWQRLRDETGLDGNQAGEITGWAMDTLWRALEAEDERVRRRGG